jgi:tetratricopeptide (TPR) repeat protein
MSNAAIRDYQQAVEQDPDFALAYAQLARALVTSYHYGYNREPGQLVTAKLAADRALTLAPDLAKAHIAKAIWYYLGKNNSTAALDEFKRALVLKSQDPIIHLYIGSIYRRRGHWNAALREMSAAAALDPQNVIVLKKASSEKFVGSFRHG